MDRLAGDIRDVEGQRLEEELDADDDREDRDHDRSRRRRDSGLRREGPVPHAPDRAE